MRQTPVSYAMTFGGLWDEFCDYEEFCVCEPGFDSLKKISSGDTKVILLSSSSMIWNDDALFSNFIKMTLDNCSLVKSDSAFPILGDFDVNLSLWRDRKFECADTEMPAYLHVLRAISGAKAGLHPMPAVGCYDKKGFFLKEKIYCDKQHGRCLWQDLFKGKATQEGGELVPLESGDVEMPEIASDELTPLEQPTSVDAKIYTSSFPPGFAGPIFFLKGVTRTGQGTREELERAGKSMQDVRDTLGVDESNLESLPGRPLYVLLLPEPGKWANKLVGDEIEEVQNWLTRFAVTYCSKLPTAKSTLDGAQGYTSTTGRLQ